MRSKKNPKNSRILLASKTSIAGCNLVNLAMLFCHAGFDVFTAYLSESITFIPTQLLQEITGHAPMCSNNLPGWTKSRRDFSFSLLIDADQKEINQVADPENNFEKSSLISYIKKKSKHICIAHSKPKIISRMNEKLSFFEIPDNPMLFENFNFNLFARAIRYLVGQKLFANYKFYVDENILSSCKVCSNLYYAFIKNGLKPAIKELAEISISVASSKESGFENFSTDPKKTLLQIYVFENESELSKQKNKFADISRNFMLVTEKTEGLMVFYDNQMRLIPSLNEYSIYQRVVDLVGYMIKHLTIGKENQ